MMPLFPTDPAVLRAGARRFFRAMRTALLVGVVAALVSPVAAHVIPLRLEELMAVADDVVVVRCHNTETSFHEGKIITRADVIVLETIKGTMKGKEHLTYLGGKYEGIVMTVPDQPRLEEGEEAILFLNRPYDRMPAETRAEYNAASPLVSSRHFVGGWQGKLRIFPTPGTSYTRSGDEPVPETTRVARVTPRNVEPGINQAPSFGELRAALYELEQDQREVTARGGEKRRISGMRGEFAIPEISDKQIIRAFDPLPSMAYMSVEEFEALEAEVRARSNGQAGQQADADGAEENGEE